MPCHGPGHHDGGGCGARPWPSDAGGEAKGAGPGVPRVPGPLALGFLGFLDLRRLRLQRHLAMAWRRRRSRHRAALDPVAWHGNIILGIIIVWVLVLGCVWVLRIWWCNVGIRYLVVVCAALKKFLRVPVRTGGSN